MRFLPALIVVLAVVALTVDLAAAIAIERSPSGAQTRVSLTRAVWVASLALVALVAVRFFTALI